MTVSKKIVKRFRRERGWSQEQLATICGISERTIQRIEKDGNCSLESKMAIASAFEISPMDLEDSVPSDAVFEQRRIDWSSVTGYIILLIFLPILIYLLTHTQGIWEIGCILVVDGLTLAITTVSHGVGETMGFFRNAFSPVKKAAGDNSYKVYISLANQVIQYAYTFGCLTSLVYVLVILTHATDRLHHVNIVAAEAAMPIVYAILLNELWIRPFKHKVEKHLSESMQNNKKGHPEVS